MPTHDDIKAARGDDIGDWGEKDQRGAYSGPLRIAGEQVDLDSLPPLSDNDKPPSTFYRSEHGVLARALEGGSSPPEVFDPVARTWHPCPDLDTLHDAREITHAEVLEWFPDITATDLESAPTGADRAPAANGTCGSVRNA